MIDGIINWVSQLASLWGFTIALGAPLPVALAAAPLPAQSSVLSATTVATPPPVNQPAPEPQTPPVLEPAPVQPAPVDPPVVQPVKPEPPIHCVQADDGASTHFRQCGCNYSPKPSPNVYLCRYPVDSTNQ